MLEGKNKLIIKNILKGENKMKSYKVLSQKDKWFSGKFDPAKLEEALNAYAQQGWELKVGATADVPSFGGSRQEFIAILEREED